MSDPTSEGRSIRWLAVASNFAVIAGLVFVALEIRVNTSAVLSATVQEVTNLSAEALSDLASDSTLAHLRLRGDADPSLLSELETFQYFAYYRGYWLRMQNTFFQRRLGVLDGGAWDTYARTICIDMRTPGIRATWPSHSLVLDPEFVTFVETCPSE